MNTKKYHFSNNINRIMTQRAGLLIFVLTASAVIGAFFGSLAGYSMFQRSNLVQEVSDQFGVDILPISEEEVLERQIVDLIEEETATIAVVNQVIPSVVSVVVRKEVFTIEASEYYFYDFEVEDTESLESELIEVGGGTAVFVSSNGLLITNKHVVSDLDAVYSILTNDGQEYGVTVLAEDLFMDLAVLQINQDEINGKTFPAATLGDSDDLRVGQTVIAIGNTLSEYQNTVTKGVVSGLGRRVLASDYSSSQVIEEAIQTDAAINPGNSGGPLINLLGQVIGINTAIAGSGEGIGFAIPANSVKEVVNDVLEHGRIVRPWLGVRYLMIDEFVAEENGLSVTEGALVVAGTGENEPAVLPGSPAEAAGLVEGDIIMSINGQEINALNTLAQIINEFDPGDNVTLLVMRAGEEIIMTTSLEEVTSDDL